MSYGAISTGGPTGFELPEFEIFNDGFKAPSYSMQCLHSFVNGMSGCTLKKLLTEFLFPLLQAPHSDSLPRKLNDVAMASFIYQLILGALGKKCPENHPSNSNGYNNPLDDHLVVWCQFLDQLASTHAMIPMRIAAIQCVGHIILQEIQTIFDDASSNIELSSTTDSSKSEVLLLSVDVLVRSITYDPSIDVR